MEIWKPISGFEHGYEISNYGRVRSKGRIQSSSQGSFFRAGRILKLASTRGYLHVRLYKNAKVYDRYVHRLVAETFIENPLNKKEVNHIDGNKLNNHASNLEWCTRKHNMRHARRLGLHVPDRTKLSASEAKQIIKMRADGIPRDVVARKFGISVNHVWSVTSGESWGWATNADRQNFVLPRTAEK